MTVNQLLQRDVFTMVVSKVFFIKNDIPTVANSNNRNPAPSGFILPAYLHGLAPSFIKLIQIIPLCHSHNGMKGGGLPPHAIRYLLKFNYSQEIRTGSLSCRLLRCINPFHLCNRPFFTVQLFSNGAVIFHAFSFACFHRTKMRNNEILGIDAPLIKLLGTHPVVSHIFRKRVPGRLTLWAKTGNCSYIASNLKNFIYRCGFRVRGNQNRHANRRSDCSQFPEIHSSALTFKNCPRSFPQIIRMTARRADNSIHVKAVRA